MLGKIEAKWKLYKTVVVPSNAGENQIRESRRAFYAGAQAFFGLLMSGLDDSEDASEQDLTMMNGLHKELEQFSLDVLAGKA